MYFVLASFFLAKTLMERELKAMGGRKKWLENRDK